MPVSNRTAISGGGQYVAKTEYRMPRPPAIVVWRNAPGGESAYAVITKTNRNSVNLAIFAPESRVVVPKEAVRFIEDPWNQANGINADSGVWEYTAETKTLLGLQRLIETIVAESDKKPK